MRTRPERSSAPRAGLPSERPARPRARSGGRHGALRRSRRLHGSRGTAEIGAVTQEAWFRLRSAEQLVHKGRRAEADEQLRPAPAFYRSVGATRWIREGEALLAASA